MLQYFFTPKLEDVKFYKIIKVKEIKCDLSKN